MKQFFNLAVLAAAFLMVLPLQSQAALDPICLPRRDLDTYLATRYEEFLVAQWLNYKGALTEVFATLSGDRWTLTETDASGRSCLKAAGDYWNELPAVAPLAADRKARYGWPDASKREN